MADQIIRNLEEFCPDYFVVAQVTGIPAAEYRRIRGAVSNHKLLRAGEEIPIAVENAAPGSRHRGAPQGGGQCARTRP